AGPALAPELLARGVEEAHVEGRGRPSLAPPGRGDVGRDSDIKAEDPADRVVRPGHVPARRLVSAGLRRSELSMPLRADPDDLQPPAIGLEHLVAVLVLAERSLGLDQPHALGHRVLDL